MEELNEVVEVETTEEEIDESVLVDEGDDESKSLLPLGIGLAVGASAIGALGAFAYKKIKGKINGDSKPKLKKRLRLVTVDDDGNIVDPDEE